MTINNDSMQCVFSNLGIQCVKKRDVEDALKLREEIRVDPFQSELEYVGLVLLFFSEFVKNGYSAWNIFS